MATENKKTVIITGGASGIGLEVSKYLIDAGYHVLIVDNSLENKNTFIDSIDDEMVKSLTFLTLDLSEWRTSVLVMDYCNKNELNAFCLINNISYRSGSNLESEDLDSWEKTLSISLRSAFSLSQSFIINNYYTERKYIVNIGSITSQLISHQSPAYHVAKGGLESLTKYLAVSAPAYRSGITVNCLSLGFIVQKRHLNKFESEGNKQYRNVVIDHLPNGEVGKDLNVATAVNFLISGEADFINGAIIPLDGGATLNEQFTLAWLKT